MWSINIRIRNKHTCIISATLKYAVTILLYNEKKTYSQFKLGEGGHVNDTDGLLTALHLCPDDVKPIRFIEGLALIQRQQI